MEIKSLSMIEDDIIEYPEQTLYNCNDTFQNTQILQKSISSSNSTLYNDNNSENSFYQLFILNNEFQKPDEINTQSTQQSNIKPILLNLQQNSQTIKKPQPIIQKKNNKQTKSSSKNFIKNIHHGFYAYLKDLKKENNSAINKNFEKLNLNPSNFYKKYEQKSFSKIKTLKQFLSFFFASDMVTNQLITVPSKNNPNHRRNSQKVFNEKIMLRIMFEKFLRQDLLQYCYLKSNIKSQKEFLNLKFKIKYMFANYHVYKV